MCSGAQGPGSACGPADPEQIQANWGEGGILNPLQQQEQQVRGENWGRLFPLTRQTPPAGAAGTVSWASLC